MANANNGHSSSEPDLQAWVAGKLQQDRLALAKFWQQQSQQWLQIQAKRDKLFLAEVEKKLQMLQGPAFAQREPAEVTTEELKEWSFDAFEAAKPSIQPKISETTELSEVPMAASAELPTAKQSQKMPPGGSPLLRSQSLEKQHLHELLRQTLQADDDDDLIVDDGTGKKKKKRYSHHSLVELSGQEAEGLTGFQRRIEGPLFEMLSGTVVLISTLTMALEIQYFGFDSGYAIQHQYYTRAAKDTWPGAEQAFTILGIAYNIFFVSELILRIVSGRCAAFRSGWIWLDMAVVVPAVSLDVLGLMGISAIDWNPTMLRLLRLARMARVFKVVKLLKMFDSLLLLMRSLEASFMALVWSITLLVFVQVIAGMFLQQIVRAYIDDASVDMQVRRKMFKYFGTFTQTMLTMFEITLANWVNVCRFVTEEAGEGYALFFIVYRCMFIFAAIRVINAIFIQETMRVALSDEQIAIVKKQRQKEDHVKKLHAVFKELDDDGDGHIAWHEFEILLHDDILKTWVSTLDVDVHDFLLLFKVLDNGDGLIDIDEFIRGINEIKGFARGMDIVKLMHRTSLIDAKLHVILDGLGEHYDFEEAWELHVKEKSIEVARHMDEKT
eukprot:gnl/TRDRNA2_/TRDRNA2_148461_c0_seq1.p1 gnl/TRDRNA2_/TRDRNA2_148461_c0~~gnl/TRDRNA2_/TRDRNA2_148461_c0_seq1.p1  ORF type:complete len:611 (+),score=120.74 gnl/TRDRNA2_/TRDRNA2_148461_c0_seq1:30-1862(+)